jgi:hypothetical protein
MAHDVASEIVGGIGSLIDGLIGLAGQIGEIGVTLSANRAIDMNTPGNETDQFGDVYVDELRTKSLSDVADEMMADGFGTTSLPPRTKADAEAILRRKAQAKGIPVKN